MLDQLNINERIVYQGIIPRSSAAGSFIPASTAFPGFTGSLEMSV